MTGERAVMRFKELDEVEVSTFQGWVRAKVVDGPLWVSRVPYRMPVATEICYIVQQLPGEKFYRDAWLTTEGAMRRAFPRVGLRAVVDAFREYLIPERRGVVTEVDERRGLVTVTLDEQYRHYGGEMVCVSRRWVRRENTGE